MARAGKPIDLRPSPKCSPSRPGSAFARHRRVEQLLLPQVRDAAAGHVILEELDQRSGRVSVRA